MRFIDGPALFDKDFNANILSFDTAKTNYRITYDLDMDDVFHAVH